MAQRIRIHRLLFFAVVGWGGTGWTVLSTDPALEASVALFFVCLAFALFGTYSLAAFALSFVIFHSAAQRGNLAYASEQGFLLTALTILLVIFSIARELKPISLLILLAVFLLWQVILLVRFRNVKV